MSRKLSLGEGEAARTAGARALLRTGVVEKTGEVLSASVLADRVAWAADLVSDMTAALLAAHWNASDVDLLASGVDATGRGLPSKAWMALRRLGWSAAPPGSRTPGTTTSWSVRCWTPASGLPPPAPSSTTWGA